MCILSWRSAFTGYQHGFISTTKRTDVYLELEFSIHWLSAWLHFNHKKNCMWQYSMSRKLTTLEDPLVEQAVGIHWQLAWLHFNRNWCASQNNSRRALQSQTGISLKTLEYPPRKRVWCVFCLANPSLQQLQSMPTSKCIFSLSKSDLGSVCRV